MYKKQNLPYPVTRFKHFENKPYASFNSLHKQVTIGVLAIATLTFANPETVTAQTDRPREDSERELEGIEGMGSRVPLPQKEAARIVTVLDRKAIENAPVQSVNDLLKYAAGIDVRQRGDMGRQTDISIRGGTFDQITILLNGVNISNPQTGHLAADFPVAIEDIERIEILEGPAARVFGTSAFCGAINIVTSAEKQKHIQVNATGGSYGLGGGGLRLNLSGGAWTNQISGSYLRTDGATLNSDFDVWRAYYQGGYSTPTTNIRWQAGFSQQKYGANTFYSAKYNNQYEETDRYIVSVQADSKLGWLHLLPSLYWNRSMDHYQLIRHSSSGENFHRTDVYGLNLNAYFTTVLGKTSFGMEARSEGIFSTSLGRPLEEAQYVNVPWHKGRQYTKKDDRTNLSYFLEHNVLLPKATISLGVMANRNTGYDDKFHFYPGVDVSYRPGRDWKLTASLNMALRMPTFTDLYYKSPTQEGNVGLHPEETQAFSVGAQYRKPIIRATADIFYHKGKNMIDWVMYTADDVYHSANFKLDNYGAEADVEFDFQEVLGERFFLDRLNLVYTYIHQRRHDDVTIYKSNYALEYLRHKFVAGLTHRIWSNLSATWSFRWQDRMGYYIRYADPQDETGTLTPYRPYALLDLRLQWRTPHYQLYVEGNNLTNHTYYDVGNIPQPGFWFKVGGSYRFNF
ncbi:MAG: TonB-dependent receptor [Paraprevotella sp.]|nr:TonB-dependent receptor [Paraprevotella sp.]